VAEAPEREPAPPRAQPRARAPELSLPRRAREPERGQELEPQPEAPLAGLPSWLSQAAPLESFLAAPSSRQP
jgi:hypothetical protein